MCVPHSAFRFCHFLSLMTLDYISLLLSKVIGSNLRFSVLLEDTSNRWRGGARGSNRGRPALLT